MNVRVLLPSLCFAISSLSGCDHSKDHHNDADDGKNKWTEMDDFHMIMAEAFHPYMDSANLKPAKEKASELLSSAKKWRGSSIPEKLDKEETTGKLNKLVDLATQLAADVQTTDDKATGETLNNLHDLFHDLQNDWYGAAASEDEHHGHDHQPGHDDDHQNDHEHEDQHEHQ